MRVQELDQDLARQVHLFHQCFFREPPPAKLVERYILACRTCFADVEETDARLMETLVESRLDPEAVELALRLSKGRGLLTAKLQAYFYLVEVLPEYYAYFVNTKPGFGRGAAEIFWAGLKSAHKLVKGRLLAAKYGLL